MRLREVNANLSGTEGIRGLLHFCYSAEKAVVEEDAFA